MSAWIVAGLGVTQIIGYGTLYYAFAILAPAMSRDLGATLPWLFGVFSIATLAFGLIGPASGRAADRHGGPWVMAAGSLAAAVMIAATALAPERWTFAAAVIVTQATAAFVLYETSFVTLVQHDAADARRRITHLTLIGGFASTIFWPLTSSLLTILDWRQILVVFALAHALVCLPIHLAIARQRTRQHSRTIVAGDGAVAVSPQHGVLAREQRRRGQLLAMLAFALGGVALSGLLVHLVPMLAAAGLGTAASAVAALFGPAQVASRLINLGVGARLSAAAVGVIAASLIALGLVVLLAGGMMLWPAVAFAVLLGLGSGLTSVVRGTLPLALFGSDGYGRLLGQFTLVRVVAGAMAPLGMSLLFDAIGIWPTLVVTAAIMAASVAAFLMLHRLARPPSTGG